MRIAHFTLAELPGTLAIWAAGIALGASLLTREMRRLAPPLTLMAGIAVTSMLGESQSWSTGVEAALDLAFLGLAAGLAWSILRPGVRRSA